MNIKDAETLSGVSKRNIRFYEQKGLLTPNRNSENDYREYSETDIERLKLIRALRMLDMPLEQIREVVQGKLQLQAAVSTHRFKLKAQIRKLETAVGFCEQIAESEAPDIDALLSRMDAPAAQSQLSGRWNRDYADAILGIVVPIALGILPCLVCVFWGLMVSTLFFAWPAGGYLLSVAALFAWGSFGFSMWGQGSWVKNGVLIHVIPLIACVLYTLFHGLTGAGFLDYYIMGGYMTILAALYPFVHLAGASPDTAVLPMVLMIFAYFAGSLIAELRSWYLVKKEMPPVQKTE